MRALLLVLALLCGNAHAALPTCWPSNVGGSGTALQSGGHNLGQWWGWWCPDGKAEGVVSVHGYVLKHPTGPHASIAAMLSAYWTANVMPPDEWTMAMMVLAAERQDALNASKPATPVWKVAPNGTATTRPAYPVTGGVIGSTAAGRAPVGQPCDCSTQIKRSTTTYCAAPEPLQALVTVCRP